MNDHAQQSQATRDPLAGGNTVMHSRTSSCAILVDASKSLTVQVVHEFVGYAPIWWARALYRVLVPLSLGLIWVLGFYTVHASLWTLQECPLSSADFVCVRVSSVSMHTHNTLCLCCLCLAITVQELASVAFEFWFPSHVECTCPGLLC